MCHCLPSLAASLLLWLQQWGHPLLQPGGHQGPGRTQVGAQLAPGCTDAYGEYLWGSPGVWGGWEEQGRAIYRNLLICCPLGTWSGMVQLRAKAAGIPVWAGVTKELSPAWLPAPMAASCSVPALRAPWPSTTALPLAAASCVLQVRHHSHHLPPHLHSSTAASQPSPHLWGWGLPSIHCQQKTAFCGLTT